MRLVFVNVVALALALPSVAYACPVCFSGTENRDAFFWTFVLLTVLPLLAMGTLVWSLRKRYRRVDSARSGSQTG